MPEPTKEDKKKETPSTDKKEDTSNTSSGKSPLDVNILNEKLTEITLKIFVHFIKPLRDQQMEINEKTIGVLNILQQNNSFDPVVLQQIDYINALNLVSERSNGLYLKTIEKSIQVLGSQIFQFANTVFPVNIVLELSEVMKNITLDGLKVNREIDDLMEELDELKVPKITVKNIPPPIIDIKPINAHPSINSKSDTKADTKTDTKADTKAETKPQPNVAAQAAGGLYKNKKNKTFKIKERISHLLR